MVKTKKNRLTGVLIFLILVTMSFGQLLGHEVSEIKIHLLDLLVFSAGLYFLIRNYKNLKFPNYFNSLFVVWIVFTFSLVFSLVYFELSEIFTGFLYLVRFMYYTFFSVIIWKFAKNNKQKELIFNSLLTVGGFVAAFGFVQYFLYPDLTALKELGWDDHLYRLVGTFLDPAFTGIILVFAFIAGLAKFIRSKRKTFLVLLVLILVAIGLTYSRSSYLALLSGIGVFLYLEKRLKYLLVISVVMLAGIFLLPRPGGWGVRLERTHSIVLKLENYTNSLEVIEKSPLFGFGFNNICAVKQKLGFVENVDDHSCSGLDNSFLLVLATTGITGAIVLTSFIINLVKNSTNNIYGKTFLSSGVAMLVHAMFTNTLFYAWVLVWLMFLIGISRKTTFRNGH